MALWRCCKASKSLSLNTTKLAVIAQLHFVRAISFEMPAHMQIYESTLEWHKWSELNRNKNLQIINCAQ